MERTFLMIKPDAIQRNLVGEIISRIERKGLKLVGAKLMTVPQALAEEIPNILTSHSMVN